MRKPKLSEMTLREKIGQTALVDQRCLLGDIKKEADPREYLKKYPCGGLWVQAASNVDDINQAHGVCDDFNEESYAIKYSQLVDSLNSVLRIPLLTGADAETGGSFMFPELTTTSSAAALGAADDPTLAFEMAQCIANECSYGGVNWIWGPVIDMSNHLRGTSSEGRCFSHDNPEIIEKMAKAQIKGFQSCGIAATAKHFPSCGMLETRDSHQSMTVNYESLETWEKGQGALWQSAIDNGVWSIMTSHVSFPAVDNTRAEAGGYVPATLSKKIITDLLKKKMGFKGVVITDGLGMKSLIMTYKIERLYVEIIKAGNDMVLGVKDLEMYFNVIEEAIRNGEISEERIDDACQRILDMKEKIGLFDVKEKEKSLSIPEEVFERTRALNKKVAQKSIKKVCDDNKLIPLSEEKIKKVVAVYLGHNDATYDKVEKILTKAFKKHGATFKLQRYLDEEKMHDEHESGEKIAAENDLILYLADLPNGNCNCFTGEVWRTAVFTLIHGNEKSAVIALRSPFVYYDYFTFAKTFLCTFGISEEVLTTIVDAMYGELPFTGKMPHNLLPEYARDSLN